MPEGDKPKGVGEGCIDFYDETAKISVNLVPLEKIANIPRIGEQVLLPGTPGPGKRDGGVFQVSSVLHSFGSDENDDMSGLNPARLLQITVRVKRLS
jgi:hypothetical protein